ncbi:MAG: acyltransferase [Myxococcales bacterium]|nr:acyltransferase [Myxococcales bacterium]
MTTNATAAGARFSEVDHIKAVGILAVILVHSVRDPWNPEISTPEIWIGIVTRFAVPGFLLASGFLYATTVRIPTKTVLRRLRRLLVPYLLASLLAQLWWIGQGQAHDFPTVVKELLLGSSFGPYYYVFVHFWLVLFVALFAILPRRVLWGLTAVMLLAQIVVQGRLALRFPLFWQLRGPLFWWAYFLIGFMLRLYYEPVRRLLTKHHGVFCALAAAIAMVCVAVAFNQPYSQLGRTATWLYNYAIIALLFGATCGRGEPRWSVRLLADASFAIYLLHIFFVYAAAGLFQPAKDEFDLVVIGGYWCAGLFGSLSVVGLVRTALGPRSRDVIGA